MSHKSKYRSRVYVPSHDGKREAAALRALADYERMANRELSREVLRMRYEVMLSIYNNTPDIMFGTTEERTRRVMLEAIIDVAREQGWME